MARLEHSSQCSEAQRRALAGLRVAVTRPAAQCESLRRQLEANGAHVIGFPVLAIEPVSDPAPVRARAAGLCGFDIAIFVSANAVHHGVPIALAGRAWPEGVRVAAVGAATARALRHAGVRVDLLPEGSMSSEGLLALPAFQADAIDGCRVAIFRGRGGRALLGDELVARGAVVEYLEVYERRKPDTGGAQFLALARQGEVDVVMIGSGEGLRNMFEMIGESGRDWLCDVPLLVVSERLAREALHLGVRRRPIVAAGAADERLVEALIGWQARRSGDDDR